MSELLKRLRRLTSEGRVRISYHGDEELRDEVIAATEAVAGLEQAEVIETYADTGRGPSLLALQYDRNQRPIHVVWGVAHDHSIGPAVLVTAYRPDPDKWHADMRTRKKHE